MKKRLLALLLSLSLAVSIAVPGTVATDSGNFIEDDFVYIDEHSLPIDKHVSFDAADFSIPAGSQDYQWQIKIGGEWVNISGADSAVLNASYAMLYNALDGDVATLRCTAYDAEGNLIEGAGIPVTINSDVEPPRSEQKEINLRDLVTEGAKVIYERINDIVTILNGEVQDRYDEIKDQIKDEIKDNLDDLKGDLSDKFDDLKDKLGDLTGGSDYELGNDEETTAPEPEDTTTAPEPEDTTTAPEPEDTTTAPEPEDTTTAPEPEDTTTAPEPEDTTTAPEPEDTTTAP